MNCVKIWKIFCYTQIFEYVFTACECYEGGTLEEGNQEKCNVTDGACECKIGYTNQQCNACDSGYFNAAHGTSSPFTCIGKLKNMAQCTQ